MYGRPIASSGAEYGFTKTGGASSNSNVPGTAAFASRSTSRTICPEILAAVFQSATPAVWRINEKTTTVAVTALPNRRAPRDEELQRRFSTIERKTAVPASVKYRCLVVP